jgi:hypothetical protein
MLDAQGWWVNGFPRAPPPRALSSTFPPGHPPGHPAALPTFPPGPAATNVDAIVYLMLANDLIHELLPDAVTIAEDVSGGWVGGRAGGRAGGRGLGYICTPV